MIKLKTVRIDVFTFTYRPWQHENTMSIVAWKTKPFSVRLKATKNFSN